MANQNPSPKTRFTPNPDQLASKPISVRLPASIDAQVRELGGDWIRAVLMDAIQKLNKKDNRHE